MPRLGRLRLVSIGHPNARFRDVTIDLRDAAGRATDSTVWLRNGGGKSTLVSLLFALVRPDQREFLGTKADAKRRRLQDYVLAQDRAVVVAEWELDGQTGNGDADPARFITGVFFEWRSGASTDDGNLRRLYFAGRVSVEVGLGIDTLPLFLDGNGSGITKRRSLTAFLEEWNDLRGRHPHLELSATTTLRDWADTLEHAGLDPDLFLYQLRMNQREGGADEIFRFPDHEAFVDFLLELAFNPERAEAVSKNIGRYREELRRRKEEYLPERELVGGIADRMRPMADMAARRTELRSEVATARGRLSALGTTSGLGSWRFGKRPLAARPRARQPSARRKQREMPRERAAPGRLN